MFKKLLLVIFLCIAGLQDYTVSKDSAKGALEKYKESLKQRQAERDKTVNPDGGGWEKGYVLIHGCDRGHRHGSYHHGHHRHHCDPYYGLYGPYAPLGPRLHIVF